MLKEKLTLFCLMQYPLSFVVRGLESDWRGLWPLAPLSCAASGRSLSPSELQFLWLKTYDVYVYSYSGDTVSVKRAQCSQGVLTEFLVNLKCSELL